MSGNNNHIIIKKKYELYYKSWSAFLKLTHYIQSNVPWWYILKLIQTSLDLCNRDEMKIKQIIIYMS